VRAAFQTVRGSVGNPVVHTALRNALTNRRRYDDFDAFRHALHDADRNALFDHLAAGYPFIVGSLRGKIAWLRDQAQAVPLLDADHAGETGAMEAVSMHTEDHREPWWTLDIGRSDQAVEAWCEGVEDCLRNAPELASHR
jgi:hypothetical protein